MTPTLPPNAANCLKRRRLRVELAEITASLTEGFWSQQMPQIAQIFKTRRKRKKPQKKNHEKHRKELTNCLVV